TLESIWKIAHFANRYIERKTPWVLSKDPEQKDELLRVMYRLLDCSRVMALLVYPFIPATALRLWEMLGMKKPLVDSIIPDDLSWEKGPEIFEPQKAEPLFPRIV
ncbi:MAG: class I tRNA ligase family protein, partial [Candidatus Atribacteria bacterium]|nr:class I tRNA ligase family protein [Candidatus Atribacteria bacterium]